MLATKRAAFLVKSVQRILRLRNGACRVVNHLFLARFDRLQTILVPFQTRTADNGGGGGKGGGKGGLQQEP